MVLTFVNFSFEDPTTSGVPILDSETQEVITAEGWAGGGTGAGWASALFIAASATQPGSFYADVAEKFGDPAGWAGIDETYLFSYTSPTIPGELIFAIFEQGPEAQTVEDYEEFWGPFDGSNPDYATKVNVGFQDNRVFFTELPTNIVSASFDAGTSQQFEDYEEEWGPFDGTNPDYATKVGAGFPSNETFFENLGDVTTVAAIFDSAATPEAVEDFEELWQGNEDFDFDWTTVTPDAATFDGFNPEDFEDFEETIEESDLITVRTSPPAGDYIVFINGRPHTYVSPGSETVTQIRDGLSGVISGTPEGVTPADKGTDQITLTQNILPATYTLGVQAPSNKLGIDDVGTPQFWSGRSAMATFPFV